MKTIVSLAIAALLSIGSLQLASAENQILLPDSLARNNVLSASTFDSLLSLQILPFYYFEVSPPLEFEEWMFRPEEIFDNLLYEEPLKFEKWMFCCDRFPEPKLELEPWMLETKPLK